MDLRHSLGWYAGVSCLVFYVFGREVRETQCQYVFCCKEEREGTNLLDVFFALDLLLLLATQELLELFPPRLNLFIA